MKTFQDLMQENPTTVTQNTNTKEGGTDVLTRWYNMYWGTLTDTHMQLLPDGTYVVIGSRLSRDKWDNILFSRVVRTAPGTLLPHTWDEVLRVNHMGWTWTMHNGQPAVAMAVQEGYHSGELIIPPITSVGVNQCCGCVDAAGC